MADFDRMWFISNQQQGQPVEWLNGVTGDQAVNVKTSIMTAVAECDLTGTRWRFEKAGNYYRLRCLGDDNPDLFLDGLTQDGGVQLTPDPGNSGTQWKFERQNNGGYLIVCQGTGGGGYALLQLVEGNVQLAPKTTPIDGTTIWYVYQVTSAKPPAVQ